MELFFIEVGDRNLIFVTTNLVFGLHHRGLHRAARGNRWGALLFVYVLGYLVDGIIGIVLYLVCVIDLGRGELVRAVEQFVVGAPDSVVGSVCAGEAAQRLDQLALILHADQVLDAFVLDVEFRPHKVRVY